MSPGSPPVGHGPVAAEPAQRYGLRLLLLAGAVAAIAIPFATLTFNVVQGGPLISWDGRVADRLNAWVYERRGVRVPLQAASFLGRPAVLAVVVLVAAHRCLSHGRTRLAIFLLATTASGAILGTVVKLVVARPRPVVDHPVATAFGKSFPSGHAMHATIAYGALLLVILPVVSPRARGYLVAITVVAVAAIGSSRLLLGVHFLTDVVGGYVLGGAWLVAGAAVFETWRQETVGVDGQDDRLGSSAPEGVSSYCPTGGDLRTHRGGDQWNA